jgi:hypothetical protein
MLQVVLERDGVEVIAVAGVTDAVSRVVEEKVDPPQSDDMRHAGNGVSVVGAISERDAESSRGRTLSSSLKNPWNTQSRVS